MIPTSKSHTLLLLAFTSLIAGGCLVKTGEYKVPAGPHDEARIYRAKKVTLEDGVSTMADVEQMLGPPDYTADDGRLVAYRWQRVRYETRALVPRKIRLDEDTTLDFDPCNRASQPVATAIRYTSLVLRFDEAGLLQAHRKFRHDVTYGGPPSLPHLLSEWQDAKASR